MWETDHRVPEETQASAAGQDDAVARQSRFRSKRPQLTRSSFFYSTFLNERWQIASLDHGVFIDNIMYRSSAKVASLRARPTHRLAAVAKKPDLVGAFWLRAGTPLFLGYMIESAGRRLPCVPLCTGGQNEAAIFSRTPLHAAFSLIANMLLAGLVVLVLVLSVS